MSQTSKFKQRVYPVLFMFVVTVVFITVVSGIYLSTRENIRINEFLFLKRAILNAADIAVPEVRGDIEQVFQARVTEVKAPDETTRYYGIRTESGQASGYVVVVTGAGLWGEITAVMGFTADLGQLTGIDFTKQNETPGLGARITEEWFKEQFRYRSGPFTLVPEGEAAGGREIDAITGATITSTAVRNIVNDTIARVPSIVGRQ